MSKYINKPITVTTRDHCPRSFYYHQWYWVEEISDYWREIGQWWLGESELHVYRVNSPQGGFELHFFPNSHQWVLYKIQD